MEGEIINERIEKLKKAASTCEFGQNLSVTLRDIFIIGLRPGKIKDRLFEEESTITYRKAVALALKKETTMAISTGNVNILQKASNYNHGYKKRHEQP